MTETIWSRPVSSRSMADRLCEQIDAALGRVTEAAAAVVLCVEILILGASIVARTLGVAMVWSEELESILFLWLAMLGSVIALRQGRHMRMTALVTRLSDAGRDVAETLALVAMGGFAILLLPEATGYAIAQNVIHTPALGVSGSLRTAAMPVGFALILATSLTKLIRHKWRDLAIALLGLIVLGGAIALAAPAFEAMGNWALVFFFVFLLGTGIAAGVPIGFAFGLATFAYLADVGGIPMSVMVGQMQEGMSALILLAVPLFVFLGALIEMTGMARAMVDSLATLFGHFRGGLSYVLLGGMYIVSGISGAKAADMAAVAPVLFPEMRKRGIPDGELVSLLSASGAMGETIPPSLVLIILGSVTGTSIAGLFAGGMLPALVLAIALALISRHNAGRDGLGGTKRAPFGLMGRNFVIAIPALIVPFLIRFAVADGVATATEVSTIGIFYSVVIGLVIYRQFDWHRLYPILVETASLSGAILFIIGAASCMSWALTQSGFAQTLSTAMRDAPGGQAGFLIVSIVMFIILGSVLEGIPAMVLFGPLVFPIAQAVGVNEIHYAIVVILAMGIGLFAPPFGVGYYAACVIGRIDPNAGMRRIWPYLGALLIGLLIVAFVPAITTILLPSGQ
ncbi:MAG TPA: TRAP transporter large permease subunit [Acidiphilium sp.]